MHTVSLVLALIAVYGGTAGALAFVMRRLKAKRVVEQLLSSQLAALQTKYKDVIELEAFKANLQRDIAITVEEIALLCNVSRDVVSKARGAADIPSKGITNRAERCRTYLFALA